LYEAHRKGLANPLPALAIQYADYAQWQRAWLSREALQVQIEYWREQLGGAPPLLSLPTDRARPEKQSYRGEGIAIALSASLSAQLKRLSQRLDVTLFMTLYTGFAILLARLSGQEDLVVGVPVANRQRTEVEELIGFFVNTLALRIQMHDPDGRERTVAQLLQAVKRMTLEAYKHQDVPFEQVVEALQPPRALSHTPIFQVMFSLQNTPQSHLVLPGLALTSESFSDTVIPYDLVVTFQESEPGIAGRFNFSSDLFDRATAQRWVRHLQVVLTQLAANPDCLVNSLPIVEEHEHAALIARGVTQEPTTDVIASPIHELFEANAERYPDCVALVSQEQQLSYGVLNVRANQLARYLLKQGLRTGSPVALFIGRGPNLIVAVLAVLKAGGMYVPFDPSHQDERLRYMLQDAAPALVLADCELPRDFLPTDVQLIDLEQRAERIREEDGANLRLAKAWDRIPAYAIYTSGSSGQPKAAVIEHRSLRELFAGTGTLFHFDRHDAWTLFHSIAFDFSVWEIFGALIHGARLVIVPKRTAQSPEEFYDLIASDHVTVLSQTPTAFGALTAAFRASAADHSLRYVIFGGEALEDAALQPWYARSNRIGTQFINMYGITETTVHVTYRHVAQVDGSAPVSASSIGSPLPGVHTYLLDRDLRPVPTGVAGEIFVGGTGVAQGYLHRPTLTAERFLPDPFTTTAGALMYRSGDLGRWRADGTLEYLGRNDEQVKLRGFRIELSEIGARLLTHERVREAVVLAVPGAAGTRMIAFVVPKTDLGARARRRLPNGMAIADFNSYETHHLFREIFVDEVYTRNGVVLEDGCCVLDVGANIGLFSLYVARKHPTARIFAFEPAPPLVELLRSNASEYPDAIQVQPYGLARSAGMRNLQYYAGMTVNSGLFADPVADRGNALQLMSNRSNEEASMKDALASAFQGSMYECEFRTLSQVIREQRISRIDLLKLDVEKSELEVLLGIEPPHWALIQQLVVEVHDIDGRLRTIVSLLREQGYAVTHEQDRHLTGTDIHRVTALRGARRTVPVTEPPESAGEGLAGSLRRYLKRQLPDYMIPADVVSLEALPQTSNGKIDRKALLKIATDGVPRRSITVPMGEVEQAVAAIWCEVLQIDRVSRDDDFFDLGGHSLMLTQVKARLGSVLGVDVSIDALFERPVLASLAQRIRTLQWLGNAVDRNPKDDGMRDEGTL
jgi:amino acid adenylation domain-containing protein/FkbM family methyltransferase